MIKSVVLFRKEVISKMQGTLKMLTSIQDPKFMELTDSEICQRYQTDLYKDPRLLSIMWIRHYELILLKHSNPLFSRTISFSDLASFSMECMDKSLLYFNPQCKAKFSTYFARILYNRLREEYEGLKCHKRCERLYSVSLDDCLDSEEDTKKEVSSKVFEDKYNSSLDDVEFQEFLSQIELTPKQDFYCRCKMASYENVDIARFLEITPMAVNNIRKGVKKKLMRHYNEISALG